jgi:hypothetical protein
MHSYIILTTLLALCYSNMFRIQGVELIHFHSKISKMYTYFVDMAVKI